MTQQLPIDFATARRRRDSGMKRAAEHANAEQPEWTELALNFLESCAKARAKPFLAEDILELAVAVRFPPAPDARAWGSVFKQAARKKIIAKVGYAPAKTSNCSPKVLWRSLVARAAA